jgi:hypothetical protein
MVGVRAARVRPTPGQSAEFLVLQFSEYTKFMGKSSAKKRLGRPPTGRTPFVAVRIPKPIIFAIDKLAREHQVSRSKMVHQLLMQALGKNDK